MTRMIAIAAALLTLTAASAQAAPCLAPTAPVRADALKKPEPPKRPACGELCDNAQVRAFNAQMKTFNDDIRRYNTALVDYVARLNAFVGEASQFAKCEIADVQAPTPNSDRP